MRGLVVEAQEYTQAYCVSFTRTSFATVVEEHSTASCRQVDVVAEGRMVLSERLEVTGAARADVEKICDLEHVEYLGPDFRRCGVDVGYEWLDRPGHVNIKRGRVCRVRTVSSTVWKGRFYKQGHCLQQPFGMMKQVRGRKHCNRAR